MRIAGFNHGKLGDQLISWPTFCALKAAQPDLEIVMTINKQYEAIIPLFQNQSEIVDFFITDSYENFPSAKDIEKFNIFQLDKMFNPMQPHRDEQWFLHRHQTEEVAHMHGLDIKIDKQIRLNKWFLSPDYKDYVCFAPFGGWPDYPNPKSLTVPHAQEIVDFIYKLGLKVWQFGHPDEPKLEKTERKPLTYFQNISSMLGTKALVAIDSGVNWAASAYSHPTLGLYSNSYYTRQFVGNIQPLNSNSLYLDAPNVNDINIELIKAKIIELVK